MSINIFDERLQSHSLTRPCSLAIFFVSLSPILIIRGLTLLADEDADEGDGDYVY